MTNPVKSRFYGFFYFSSRTSISNLGYIISNLDTYVIIIPVKGFLMYNEFAQKH